MAIRELTLGESLQRFVRKWAGLINDGLTERMAAQDFLRDLLDTYEVEYTPGRMQRRSNRSSRSKQWPCNHVGTDCSAPGQ